MIPIRALGGLYKALRSSGSPWQIAGGVGLGLVLGFQPLTSPLSVLVILMILFFNVNPGSAALAAAVSAAFAVLLDPVAHAIGYALLVQADFLAPCWTFLYNLPVVPFTRFNNTVVLGSLVLSLALLVPVMAATRRGVVYYRERLHAKVAASGFMKWFKLTGVWNLWEKIKRS